MSRWRRLVRSVEPGETMRTASPCSRTAGLLGACVLFVWSPSVGQGQESPSIRGDPAAVAEALAMVETMGGVEIWSRLEQVHFVHEWDIASRPDIYRENEILDLTGPRSYVTMESEIYHRVRAYSPEHRYWNIVGGEFSYADDAAFEAAMERAPFNIYRIARGIARGDPYYRVDLGPMPNLPRSHRPRVPRSRRRDPRMDPPERPQGTGRVGDDAVQLRLRTPEAVREPARPRLGDHRRWAGPLSDGLAHRERRAPGCLAVRAARRPQVTIGPTPAGRRSLDAAQAIKEDVAGIKPLRVA